MKTPIPAPGTSLRLGLLLAIAGCIAVETALATGPALTTKQLAASEMHALALRSDGTVWSWGTNRMGEMGLGTNLNSSFPKRLASISNIVSISTAPYHSLAVQGNGSVWAWGTNGNGRLGDGTANNASTPTPVAIVTNGVAVTAGGSHSLALLADGKVMAWGLNNLGQLGIPGSPATTNQPTIVSGLTNVLAIAAGTSHSIALTVNGEVWTWGYNGKGQLGLGDNSTRTTPTKVASLSNIVQVAAGGDHTLARDRDGRVFAFGFNEDGELGVGTMSDANQPLLVTNFPGAVSIGASVYHSAAVAADGTLYAWGFNSFGSVKVTRPAVVGTGQKFTSVTYGFYFLLAMKEDGSVWGWGKNSSGQRGLGSAYTTYFPYERVNPTFSFAPFPYPQMVRMARGDHDSPNYNSFVLPVDLERGVGLDSEGSDSYSYGLNVPWFLRIAKSPVYHGYQLPPGTTNLTRFKVENPIVAYGSQGGGSPLYAGQGYAFGVYAGAYDENTGRTNVIRISAYDRATFNGAATNIAPTNVWEIALPRRSVASESNAWQSFLTNGLRASLETNGLKTTVEFVDGDPNDKPWGLYWIDAIADNVVLAGYRVTHTASSTNYFYKVEVLGSAQVAAQTMAPMATNSAGGWTNLPMYTLDFETRPPWRSTFIDTPHFEGIPLPPSYAGRATEELGGLSMGATNVVTLTNDPAYTSLDSSPELFQHPILNQFVEDMGRDPLALASYVINEIELTDPFSKVESNSVVAGSINVGGIDRSALGVFQEGQGTPVEQCALLVYLLRKAGYPAAYVWPTNNNLRLLDATVSKLWGIQVKGVTFDAGSPMITNSLIAANYPWVVATIGTNCVHIFPWLKDHEIVEGANLYDYLPAKYDTGFSWVKDYVLAKTNILNLNPASNLPLNLWPKFLEAALSTNGLDQRLSLDDFGVRVFNRRNHFPTWDRLPKPNFLTNQTQVAIVKSLSESAATYPFLTNIFNRLRVEVYTNSVSAANLAFTTGDWYACNAHNRKLLIYTNTPTTLSLWLAPYISGFTNSPGSFSGTYATNVQSLQVPLAGSVAAISVRVIHQRQAVNLGVPYSYIPVSEAGGLTNEASCTRGDVASVCVSFGKVTLAMLRVHAEDYWRIERQRATNTTFVPSAIENQGTAATILGMGYFERVSRFDEFNQALHKIRGLSTFLSGLGIIGVVPRATNMQVKVDMQAKGGAVIGNSSLRLDANDDFYQVDKDYSMISLANDSAQEHDIINSTFAEQDAVSTVRLLQFASIRTTNGWAGPLELNSKNYIALGNATNAGYGTTKLKDQDTAVWQSVTAAFSGWDADYTRVLITPGLVTNNSGTYKGMGALILNLESKGALISGNKAVLNGGWSSQFSSLQPLSTPTYQLPWSLGVNNDGSLTFGLNNFNTATPQPVISPEDAALLNTASGVGKIAFSPIQDTAANINLILYGISGSTAVGLQWGKNFGSFGQEPYSGTEQNGATVYDPVDSVSGTFYVDTVDLNLPGPLPLQLRRNYLSRNLGDNQFGYGWKLNFMPFLVVATNGATNVLIEAADPDGAVVMYRGTTNSNLLLVYPQDNSTLNNNTRAGIGATANMLNARIQRYTTNGVTYILTMPDGSRRFYQQMNSFGLVSGTNHLDRIRPYLTRWEDHAGNYHTFSYGTNAMANDYGQINRIDSGNGNALVLKYDFFGRITEAFTADGRRVTYEYDTYGDLVRVVLPDASEWKYEYHHYTFTTNSQTYTDSDHLLIREAKPDGRILANAYDSLRRVTTQAATVGTNQTLVTNAFFFYSNDFTNFTNGLISGSTRIEDVFHNPTTYYYTNNLITQIVDPLQRTNIQNWFEAPETNKPGYYTRSLEYTVDPRGFTNEFRYDPNGNVTNLTLRGDLSGDGITSQSVSNLYTYTTNSLPATAIDRSGVKTAFFYEDPADAFRVTRCERSANGVGIATNRMTYADIADVVNLGFSLKTNRAYGLQVREVRADSATNEWTYDGRGFVVQSVRYARSADNPSNTDPPVTNYFAYNARGELYEKSDVLGRKTQMDYDAMGRIKWRDAIDENGVPLSREQFYYNRNGELEWYDGPRFNPDDFVWFDYDGAGRKIQEIHWRARAKADGTGLEAETGDDLYATTFYSYDAFGNLRKVTNPRGVVTTNTFDAIGRVLTRKVMETNGSVLSTEAIAYEPGGKPSSQTNALGGVTEYLYNSSGQLRYQKNPDGSTNAWRYYADGRVRREIQRNGSYWETTYDDANLSTRRVFYSSANIPLATNSTILDRRGNAAKRIDAAHNTFITTFDGLDRPKLSFGPAILTAYLTGMDPAGTNYGTNVVQEITGYAYDRSGKMLTTSNAFGERTVTTSDALGRPVLAQVYSSNGVTPLRVTSTSYSADQHSVTVTSGTGVGAVSSTSFNDNEGHTVLSVSYPSTAVREFIRRSFDAAGNLVFEAKQSASNSTVTTWQTTSMAYDGLKRLNTKVDLDGAITSFGYDAAGDLTSRTMSSNLTWSASYNNAGQILSEQDSSGASTTRNISYGYYPSGDKWAGLVKTVTEGNGVIRTNAYDDWLRIGSVKTTGTLDEQKMSCAWSYDARGLLTNITQSFATNSTGPATAIERRYNEYGLPIVDLVRIDGAPLIPVWIGWDSAGRRKQADGMNFTYRADGLMTAMNASSFGYGDNGLLIGRTNGSRAVTVDQRDGAGRLLRRTTRASSSPVLAESWSWTGDGLPASYTAVRSDFTDTRNFAYAPLTRRLAQETLSLTNGISVTNNYIFDNGASGGLGVLTGVGRVDGRTNTWSAGVDAFSRVIAETNSIVHRSADGMVNGAATLRGYVNGQPIDLRHDSRAAGPWYADLPLASGTTNTLTVYADHPSGGFSTNRAATFSIAAGARDREDSQYDGSGNVTNRVWRRADGQILRTQSLTWDALGRLVKVTERDASSNGFNFVSLFDGLGRQIRTTETTVSNNVAFASAPAPIVATFHYDPQFEFLMIGVAVTQGVLHRQDWLAYGPDMSGSYGGMAGIGGLETITAPPFDFSTLPICDAFGNVLGVVTNSIVKWSPARVSLYAPVEGYAPPRLSPRMPLHANLAWRTRPVNVAGLVQLGARPYDPARRSFLAADPLGHESDAALNTAFNGNPAAYFDANGKFSSQNNLGAFLAAGALIASETSAGGMTGEQIAMYMLTQPSFESPMASGAAPALIGPAVFLTVLFTTPNLGKPGPAGEEVYPPGMHGPMQGDIHAADQWRDSEGVLRDSAGALPDQLNPFGAANQPQYLSSDAQPHSPIQLQQLNGSLRLEQTLSQGNIVVNDTLNLGQTRPAVFDTSSGQLYVGSGAQGTHLGVTFEYGLPVGEHLVGGFIDVTASGRIIFRPESGTFPLSHRDDPGTVLDQIRGTGVSVRQF